MGERGVGEGACERGGLRTQAEVGRFNSTISLAVILRDCVCVCVWGGGGHCLFTEKCAAFIWLPMTDLETRYDPFGLQVLLARLCTQRPISVYVYTDTNQAVPCTCSMHHACPRPWINPQFLKTISYIFCQAFPVTQCFFSHLFFKLITLFMDQNNIA